MVAATPGRGRSWQTAIPATASITAEAMPRSRPWRAVTWREGTGGPLTAALARWRVQVADGSTGRAPPPRPTLPELRRQTIAAPTGIEIRCPSCRPCFIHQHPP